MRFILLLARAHASCISFWHYCMNAFIASKHSFHWLFSLTHRNFVGVSLSLQWCGRIVFVYSICSLTCSVVWLFVRSLARASHIKYYIDEITTEKCIRNTKNTHTKLLRMYVCLFFVHDHDQMNRNLQRIFSLSLSLSHSGQCKRVVYEHFRCHYSAAIADACHHKYTHTHSMPLLCVPCLWHNLDVHALAQPHSLCALKVH